jgi:hypothetical protein
MSNDNAENVAFIPNTPTCKIYLFILLGVVTTLIILFGIVGNALTIAVMAKEQKTSINCRLLMCLAIADELTLITSGLILPLNGFEDVVTLLGSSTRCQHSLFC